MKQGDHVQHKREPGTMKTGITKALFTSPTLPLTNILNQSVRNWWQTENIS